MVKELLIAAGLVFMLPACSGDDQEEPEDVVEASPDSQMDSDAGDDDGFSDAVAEANAAAAPDSGMPGMDDAGLPGTDSEVPVDEAVAEQLPGDMSPGDGSIQYVRCNVLRIRTGPGVQHGTAGFLVFNAEVHSLGSQGKWVKIAENKYVSGAFLTPERQSRPSMPSH